MNEKHRPPRELASRCSRATVAMQLALLDGGEQKGVHGFPRKGFFPSTIRSRGGEADKAMVRHRKKAPSQARKKKVEEHAQPSSHGVCGTTGSQSMHQTRTQEVVRKTGITSAGRGKARSKKREGEATNRRTLRGSDQGGSWGIRPRCITAHETNGPFI